MLTDLICELQDRIEKTNDDGPVYFIMRDWLPRLKAEAAEVADAYRHAGRAIGSDPSYDSNGTVHALANWCGQLREELAELRAEKESNT